MSAVDQTITLPAITPATPLVLCNAGFLNTLAQVEREVANIKVDATTAQAAANLLTRLTSAGTVLEKARAELKAPFIAKGREIDEAARAPAGRIEAAKSGIKAKVAAFQQEQERLAREAEVARQKELQRLEAKRIAEERAAILIAEERAAALAAKVAPQDIPEFDDGSEPEPAPKTETEKLIEKLQYAPAVAPVKPVGVAYRVALVIDKIEVDKLPDTFVTRTAKEAALRSTFCAGWRETDPIPECPGCTFRISKTIVSTGKNEF